VPFGVEVEDSPLLSASVAEVSSRLIIEIEARLCIVVEGTDSLKLLAPNPLDVLQIFGIEGLIVTMKMLKDFFFIQPLLFSSFIKENH